MITALLGGSAWVEEEFFFSQVIPIELCIQIVHSRDNKSQNTQIFSALKTFLTFQFWTKAGGLLIPFWES